MCTFLHKNVDIKKIEHEFQLFMKVSVKSQSLLQECDLVTTKQKSIK